jgi:L-malate glycosyltransferase
MHRVAMARAQRIVFNSPYTRERVGDPRGAESVVIPNALPDDAWHPTERRLPDPARPVYVSVNNGFDRLKNVQRLIRAFARVRACIPAASLHLVGSGFEPGGPANAWADQIGIATGITFMGALDYASTMATIRAADVLMHPSLEESFGYTLIEAASQGTPVIGGAGSGAVPWVLDDGGSGVLVDVTSPTAIAEAMVGLVGDAQRWVELRERAFVTCQGRFSTSIVAAAYVRLLEGIAHARSARSR